MNPIRQELTKEYMARLEAYTLEVKRKMQASQYAGARKSTAKGNSLEFSDFRDYAPGDDLRRIDWNGAARFDKLFLKLFLEEKQANVHLVLDTSASMSALEEKSDASRLLAASIAYIALKNMDRVHLFACGPTAPPPKTGLQSRQSFLEAVTFLDELPYGGETRLSAGLKSLAGGLRPGGITLVFSDFFSPDGYEEGVKALQQQKQDVVLVQVLSAAERNPAYEGTLRLIDAETGAGLDLEMSPDLLAAYTENRLAYETALQRFCTRRGARFVSVAPEKGLLQNLNAILA